MIWETPNQEMAVLMHPGLLFLEQNVLFVS